jgi:hypothetical protein
LYIVSIYGVMLVILVLRFGPQLYFTQDAESQQDFDDVVDDDSALDWDSTDDSSTGYSIDEDEEDLKRIPESTIWGSGNDINLGYPLSSRGETTEDEGIRSSWTRQGQDAIHSMSRHSSAPNLATYETPIRDGTSRGRMRKSSKQTKTPPQPSFHS